MNTTTSFIDIKEIIKYAENYLMEKLNTTASIVIRPDGQYTLTIPNTDKTVTDYLKLHNDLHLWEAETLNEGNYGPAFIAEIPYDGTVGTCRGFGHTAEEAKENAFKLFKQVYPMALEDIVANALKHKGHLQDTDTESELWQKLNNLIPNAASNDGTGTFTNEELIQFVEDWTGINVFDLSSGAANEGGSTLKESAGYNDKLGGDPEDFISDIQSIKDKLNEIDTNKFATKLAYEVWEQFDDTCDYQIQSTKDRFLNESYNYIGKDTGEAGRNDKSHMEHIYTVYDCFGEVDTFKSKEDAEKYIEDHKDDEMYTEEYGCSNGPEFRIDEDDIEVNNKKIVVKDDLAESEKVKESEKTLAVDSWTFTE